MIGILETPRGRVIVEDDEIGRKLLEMFEENKKLRKEISDLKVHHFKELIKMKYNYR